MDSVQFVIQETIHITAARTPDPACLPTDYRFLKLTFLVINEYYLYLFMGMKNPNKQNLR